MFISASRANTSVYVCVNNFPSFHQAVSLLRIVRKKNRMSVEFMKKELKKGKKTKSPRCSLAWQIHRTVATTWRRASHKNVGRSWLKKKEKKCGTQRKSTRALSRWIFSSHYYFLLLLLFPTHGNNKNSNDNNNIKNRNKYRGETRQPTPNSHFSIPISNSRMNCPTSRSRKIPRLSVRHVRNESGHTSLEKVSITSFIK